MVILATHLAKACQQSLNLILPKNNEMASFPTIKEMKSIGVVSPFFIGDTLLSSTFLQNLAQQCSPETQLTLIAPPSHLNLLETLPNSYTYVLAPHKQIQRIELLQALGCETLFLLQFSLPWGLASFKAGIPNRIGLNLERFGLDCLQKWGNLLTHSVSSGTFDSKIHQIELYKRFFELLEQPWDETIRPKVVLTQADQLQAAAILEQIPSTHFMINLSAGSPGKQWPMDYWSVLLKALYQKYQTSFIAVGTPKDTYRYQHLEKDSKLPIFNLCGKTTLRESAALCKQCDLIITLDTALAHIASAVDAPRLVVLYGPTNFQQWRPLISEKTQLEQVYRHISCRPCLTRLCYHKSCINFLTPEKVFNHIERLMASGF